MHLVTSEKSFFIFEGRHVDQIVWHVVLIVERIKRFFRDSFSNTRTPFCVSQYGPIRGFRNFILKKARPEFFFWLTQVSRGSLLWPLDNFAFGQKVALATQPYENPIVACEFFFQIARSCLLYTSDAADEA